MDASAPQDDIVYITGIKKSVPFLKVFARKKHSKHSDFLKKKLVELFNNTEYLTLRPQENCIAKLAEDKFERCRIVSINTDDYRASIFCYDTAATADLTLDRLRILNDENLEAIGPLYREFIIAGLKFKDSIKSNQKTNQKLLKIRNYLVSSRSDTPFYFKMTMQIHDEYNTFISLVSEVDGKNFAQDVILKGDFGDIFESVSIASQSEILERQKQYRSNQDAPYIHTGLNVSSTGEKGDHRQVSIVNFDQGIKSFYVRHLDDEYHELQTIINNPSTHYECLRFYPLPQVGTRCIVQHNHLKFRACIEHVDLRKNTVRVLLIDNGMKYDIEKNEVFVMPNNISGLPAMAKRFQLAGFDDDDSWEIDNHLDLYNYLFAVHVKDKTLTLEYRHSQLANISRIPSCHLYADDVDISSRISSYDPHKIIAPPLQEELVKTQDYEVEVVHTSSVTQFHVHLRENSEKLEEMESKLRVGTPPRMPDPKVGDYVVAFLFYKLMRCRIEEGFGTGGRVFQVYALDYGFREDIHVSNLKIMSSEIAKYPPFAYQCYLKKFSGTKFDEDCSASGNEEFIAVCDKVKKFRMFVSGKKITNVVHYEVDLTDDCMQSVSDYMTEFEKKQETSADFSNATSIETHFKKTGEQEAVRNDDDNDVFEETICHSPEREIEERTLTNRQIHNSTQNSDGLPAHKELAPSSVKDWNEATESSQNSANSANQPSTSGLGSSISDGKDLLDCEIVRVTELTSPHRFTIQKYSDFSSFEAYKEEIQAEAEVATIFEEYFVNNYILAYSEIAKSWHRAQIVDVDVESVNQIFVVVTSLDDGTSFCIVDPKMIKKMSVKLTSLPQMKQSCSLPVDYLRKFEDNITKILQKYHMTEGMSYHPITTFKDSLYIELFDKKGKNIVDLLVETKFCRRTFVVPDGKSKIINYKDFENFIVINERSYDILNSIKVASEIMGEVRPSTEHKVCKIVWAKSGDEWHRARITRIEGDNVFHVYLIDYGIDEIVKEIRDIQDHNILRIPPLAYKCSIFSESNILKNENEKREEIDARVRKILEEVGYEICVQMREPGVDFAKVDFIITEKDENRVMERSVCEEIFAKQPSLDENSNNVIRVHVDQEWPGF